MNKSSELNGLRYTRDKHGLITQEGQSLNCAFFQDFSMYEKSNYFCLEM